MKISYLAIGLLGSLITIAAATGCGSGAPTSGGTLSGMIQSSDGELLAGVPIRAHLPGTNVAVTVYSNQEGGYAYRDLSPGSYTVSVEATGFEPVQEEAVNIAPEAIAQLDIALQSRTPKLDELTTSEVLLALPGSEKLKTEAARCSNCHPLQFAMQQKRDRAGWLATIEKMRGIIPSGAMQSQEAYQAVLRRTHDTNHKLADFFASVRGPDSPDLPFKLFPRPMESASTNLEVTEYRISRGESSVIFRGDKRGAWLHDVIPDPNGRYVWYTDHFTNVLGRVDPESGEITEYPYPHTKPGKQEGSHKLLFDRDGNIWLGVSWQGTIAKFDPRTEQFTQWTIKDHTPRFGMFGLDSAGNVWIGSSPDSSIYKLDTQTGKFTQYVIPTQRGVYGVAVDSKDVVYFCELNGGKVGRFDPKTEKFTEWTTPTPDSGPRRLDIDAQDRLWFAEFYAGNLAMLDPETEEIREWKISENPYAAPYDVAVDDINGTVWTNDFNNNRVFRFDMETEQITEFLLPEADVEIRHLFADGSTTPATVWIPDYSPPGKILKLRAW